MSADEEGIVTDEKGITTRAIESEMKRAYLDYSMSVIAGRALPDVRDGLKPVQRRILYAMNGEGLRSNRRHSKSAGVVGEVIKKYHPHGDSAIYDAMVRLAQWWNLRYPLVDGQGNFGSIDGDSAAAYRYTEARMTRVAEALLEDIDKETVAFVDNFDGSTLEPTVLPAKLPNLLLNGTAGIAVGMATNIPPHNGSETINAVIAFIENPDITIEELMHHLPGPDFPTGGEIVNSTVIRTGYETGRAQLRVRGVWHTEEHSGRMWIVITQIPYQLSKSGLIEEIAEGVRAERIEGIHDLRDESDKDGMRLVIELKRDITLELVENQLLKHTRLETTYGMNLVAIDKGQPKTFSLVELIRTFIDHRFEVVTKRTEHELRKAQERSHVLEGLIIALDRIDEVIEDIKASASAAEARTMLETKYALSEIQAQAILEMRLQKLSALETQQIKEEHHELALRIERYRAILADPKEVFAIIKNELEEARSIIGTERLTELSQKVSIDIDEENLIAEEQVVVTVTNKGYIKRMPLSEYRIQRRGGRGLTAARAVDDDFVSRTIVCSTHTWLLLFSSTGQLYWMRVWKIPEGSRTSKGRPLVNLVTLAPDETITTYLTTDDFAEGTYLFFVTKAGQVKRTPLSAFSNVRVTGIRAITLNGDELVNVTLTDGKDRILIGTAKGKSIMFDETDVRAMGRTAYGVRGIRLSPGDSVVGVAKRSDGPHVLTIKSDGLGKRTPFEDYRLQSRGGSGVINIKNGTTRVIGVAAAGDDHGLIVITEKGVLIRTRVAPISLIGRSTKGVRIIRPDEGDSAQSFTVVPADELEPAELQND
jgi:DNA gyrase subunit A